jgi:hypothetical protein
MKRSMIPPSLTADQFLMAISIKPKKLISQNGKMKKSHFHDFNLPAFKAFYAKDGKLIPHVTCPGAGACAAFCYASQGTYTFSRVKVAHSRNLTMVMVDREAWKKQIIDELHQIVKFGKINAFRVHTSGDFFDASYYDDWLTIAKNFPSLQFYAYSKMVKMIKNHHRKVDNFSVIFSYGGKQDSLIDPKKNRHSRVFKTYEDMINEGYSDTTETDENAANPKLKKIGLVYHGIMNLSTVENYL